MGSSRARRGTMRAAMQTVGRALGCSSHVVALEALPLIRSLASHEAQAMELMLNLNLETDEIAFLMGRKASSKEMKQFFKQVAEMELERAATPEIGAQKQPSSSSETKISEIELGDRPRSSSEPEPVEVDEAEVAATEKKGKQTALFDF